MTTTTNSASGGASREAVAELAMALSKAATARSRAEEQIVAIKAELRELLGDEFTDGGQIKTRNGTIAACIRRTGRRFDPIKAGSILPDGVIQQISTMQIDSKVAKVKLPADVYSKCMSDGQLSIVIK